MKNQLPDPYDIALDEYSGAKTVYQAHPCKATKDDLDVAEAAYNFALKQRMKSEPMTIKGFFILCFIFAILALVPAAIIWSVLRTL